MWYICNGILLGHKKEWHSERCDNMAEPCKHDAKWNKQDTKGKKCSVISHIKYLNSQQLP